MSKYLEKKLLKICKSVVKDKKFAGIHEPLIDEKEIKEVSKSLESTFVSTNGEYIKKFSDHIKKITKSKYVLLLNSGTSALDLSIKTLGLPVGSEVIVPPISFVATANVLTYNFITPIFVDVDINNYGICPDKLEQKLKKIVIFKNNKPLNRKTKKLISGIIPVHIFGRACKIDRIKMIGNKYNIPIIEDATECLYSFYKKKHLGTFGNIGTLSFNGNKIITTGAGGALITNSKKLFLKAHHLASVSKLKHKWDFIHDMVGYNFKMPNINAALGLAQIKKIQLIIKKKKNLHKKYQRAFNKSEYFSLITDNKYQNSNNWLNYIELFEGCTLKKRNLILDFLNQNNIQARPIWMPLCNLPMYQKFKTKDLKNCFIIHKKIICLPSSPSYG